jgi:hypothetical protein
LRLARREERGLIYVGRVGTGWDRKTARAIRHALEPLARPTAPKATIATPFPKVVFRPIAGDDELLHFNAAWLPHNDNPALRRFLSLARSTAKKKRSRAGAVSGPTSLGSPVTSVISLFLATLGALARKARSVDMTPADQQAASTT